MGAAQIPLDFLIHICTKNPIAVWGIEHLLTSNPSSWRFALWLPNQLLILPPGLHILLIDVSSITEWPETVRKWTDAGHRTILLTAKNSISRNAALRALHLGVRGIVPISQDFPRELPEAISSVAKGQLFASADILDDFYCGSRRLRPRSVTPLLSFREEQVVDLLIKGFSNKKIGLILEISERTAKFHVCNLLRKLRVRTRRELIDKYAEVLDQHKSA